LDAEKNNNYRDASSENEEINTKDQFFTKLNEVTTDIRNTRELFSLDDVNDRIGREINSKIVESHEEERINDNSTPLIDICRYNNLTIKNEFFNKQLLKYT